VHTGTKYGIMSMTNKIKDALVYTGLAGSIISILAYILVTIAIVKGFENGLQLMQHLLFAGIGALFGIMFNFNIGIQGISLAKREKKSIEVNNMYQKLIADNKTDEKYHTINYYMIKATIIDVLVKGSLIVLFTYMILYVFVSGNGDYSLFLLALANICVSISFGLLRITSMYNNYVERHIPFLEGLCNRLKLKPGGVDTTKGA